MHESQLRAIEARYGEVQTGVQRRKVSRHDPRGASVVNRGAMQGGDRMRHHGYADGYAEHLPDTLPDGAIVVELGVLRGHGLALLADLYPNCRLIGLDVDTSHYEEHAPTLRGLGAFAQCAPEVYEFDELDSQSWRFLAGLLPQRSVSIWIDDALHEDEPIVSTVMSAHGFMRSEALYFIEDNDRVALRLHRYLPSCVVRPYGRLTVIRT